MIPFVAFTLLAFLMLRLTFRWRFRTVLIVAVLLGLAGDVTVDLLIALRH